MRIISYILIFSIFYFCACSSTYWFSQAELTYDELNEKIKDEDGSIILKNGKEFEGKAIKVRYESTQWTDLKTEKPQRISTSKVNKIITKQYGKGALEGLGFGTIALLVIGLPTSSARAPNIYVLPAPLIGTIIGAVVGHKNTFIINEQKSGATVRIELAALTKESEERIVVYWNNNQIILPESDLLKIERVISDNKEENIFITLPEEVYDEKFKKL